MKDNWIDVTVPVVKGMLHWPGDPDVDIYKLGAIADGDGANISGINFGLHTGTHMDAPLHFLEGAGDIASVNTGKLIGKCRVLEIKHPSFVGVEELSKKNLQNTERLLFKTRNSDIEWFNREFTEDYVYLADDAAEYLAGRDIKLLGIDYLSIGEFKKGKKTHQVLLEKEIVVIEGVYLQNVPEGDYDLIALPLRIPGADGSPARVLLKKI